MVLRGLNPVDMHHKQLSDRTRGDDVGVAQDDVLAVLDLQRDSVVRHTQPERHGLGVARQGRDFGHLQADASCGCWVADADRADAH